MDSSWKGKTPSKENLESNQKPFICHIQNRFLHYQPSQFLIVQHFLLDDAWCPSLAAYFQRSCSRAINKGPSISRLCIYFYPYTLNKQSWHIAVPVCDYREPALRIQFFKRGMTTSVMSVWHLQRSPFLKSIVLAGASSSLTLLSFQSAVISFL